MINNVHGQNSESIISNDYENAKTKLGLEVRIPDQNLNVVGIRGSQEDLKKIFRGIYDGLASMDHQDYEVERGWEEISKGQHLRPGVCMITIKNAVSEQPPEMLIINVNAANNVPLINDMHAAVKNSIVNAAENL